jgi:hypothetical protein
LYSAEQAGVQNLLCWGNYYSQSPIELITEF